MRVLLLLFALLLMPSSLPAQGRDFPPKLIVQTSLAADELTLSFAKALIAGESLGTDAVTGFVARID